MRNIRQLHYILRAAVLLGTQIWGKKKKKYQVSWYVYQIYIIRTINYKCIVFTVLRCYRAPKSGGLKVNKKMTSIVVYVSKSEKNISVNNICHLCQ